jgi:NDP-sugar pyrophosphorylase family protein
MTSALILTAGLGTRLDPITRLVAKGAVPLGDDTLIERAIAWLRAEGVRDVVLNLHHRPESIAAVVGDGVHLGVRARYSWEAPILGSAGGPRRALPLVATDPILIVNGDTLCSLPLAPMIEAHARTGADVTMAVVRNPAPDQYNGIVMDDERRIQGFVPRGQAHGTWHFIGVQIAQASVFSELADGVPAETVSGIYRDFVESGSRRLFAWPVTLPFIDVGTPEDYLRAALSLRTATAGAESVIVPGASVDPSARLTDSLVWADARISANAGLDECIVAGPVDVPAGFTAKRAVLMPASVVREGDRASIKNGVATFEL